MTEPTPQPDRTELSQELSRMVAAARQKFADSDGPREAFEALGKVHTARMKEIIAEIGWPTNTKVGKDGAFDAWLLVQHADDEAEFHAHCLELMRACEPEEVGLRLIGYLDDRVRAAAGRAQLYGTQFQEGADGKPEPWPIEDVEHLDERRAAIGLGPFEDYRRQMEGG